MIIKSKRQLQAMNNNNQVSDYNSVDNEIKTKRHTQHFAMNGTERREEKIEEVTITEKRKITRIATTRKGSHHFK